MNRIGKFKFVLAALVLALAGRADSVFGCAMCYGKTDSPLAKGMNWGIFCLLFVIGGMLAMVASFFIYLARKAAAATPVVQPQGQLIAATSDV